MHIEEDKDIADQSAWIGETLKQMRDTALPTVQDKCPHCGYWIQYPLIARRSDVELFEKMMASAFNVMRRHGITANLLADIRADCLIAMASKREPAKKGRA